MKFGSVGSPREGEGMDRGAEIRGAEAKTCRSARGRRSAPQDVIGDAAAPLAADLVDHRADHWMVVDEAGRLGRIAAGEEAFVPAAVIGEVVRDRADDRELVGDARVHRQMFADVDAGDIGADGAEVAAVFCRGVRLHVVHFHVRRPAGEPDEDDGGVGRMLGLALQFPRHDASGAETAQSEGAELEEIAAAIAGRSNGWLASWEISRQDGVHQLT